MSDQLLTENQLLLAKLESVYGTDAVPTASANAVLLQAPVLTPDIRRLVRGNLKTSLSPEAPVIGRKLHNLRFAAEIKANGDSTRYDPLFRSCGMEAPAGTVRVADGTITGTFQIGENVTQATTLATGKLLDYGGSGASAYIIVEETGGVWSTSAANNITGDTSTASMDPATALTLGKHYFPRSCDFESSTLYLYRGSCDGDALLHRFTGTYGTWGYRSVAGDYGLFDFDMKGLWNDVADATPGVPTFDNTKPPIVESTGGTFGGFAAVYQNLNFALNNRIPERPSQRADEGLAGVNITGRTPSGNIDPEATLEADHPFWANLQSATPQEIVNRIGNTIGNRVQIRIRKAIMDNIEIADREGTMVNNIPFTAAKVNDAGNDEVLLSLF